MTTTKANMVQYILLTWIVGIAALCNIVYGYLENNRTAMVIGLIGVGVYVLHHCILRTFAIIKDAKRAEEFEKRRADHIRNAA